MTAEAQALESALAAKGQEAEGHRRKRLTAKQEIVGLAKQLDRQQEQMKATTKAVSVRPATSGTVVCRLACVADLAWSCFDPPTHPPTHHQSLLPSSKSLRDLLEELCEQIHMAVSGQPKGLALSASKRSLTTRSDEGSSSLVLNGSSRNLLGPPSPSTPSGAGGGAGAGSGASGGFTPVARRRGSTSSDKSTSHKLPDMFSVGVCCLPALLTVQSSPSTRTRVKPGSRHRGTACCVWRGTGAGAECVGGGAGAAYEARCAEAARVRSWRRWRRGRQL